MNIVITHARNPLMNWDVTVTIQAEGKERISSVDAEIKNSPMPVESVNPPVKTWTKTYSRVGQYPGDNKVLVTAADQDGNTTDAEDQWS